MSRRVALPSEEQVRTALAEITTTAQNSGRTPTVLGLARHLGLANATFWRHFPHIGDEISAAARTRPRPPGNGPTAQDTLTHANAGLRRANADLNAHLALAAANIQRLTLDNHRLREELETLSGITRITPTIINGT